MNKRELCDYIALHAKISPFKAREALTALEGAVSTTLKKGGSVSAGFCSYTLKTQKARTVRNPRNGDPMHVPAKKVPVIKVRKSFRVLF